MSDEKDLDRGNEESPVTEGAQNFNRDEVPATPASSGNTFAPGIRYLNQAEHPRDEWKVRPDPPKTEASEADKKQDEAGSSGRKSA